MTCFNGIVSVLDDRTDKRVDTMMERGLMQELLDFHREFNAKRKQENRYRILLWKKDVNDLLLG